MGTSNSVCLETATVYAEMVAVLQLYEQIRGLIFVEQVAEIWLALFEHVAVSYVCSTSSADDPPRELQILWDYLAGAPVWARDVGVMPQQFLAQLGRRIEDRSAHGLHEIIEGITRGGVNFAQVRPALRSVLVRRSRPLVMVMDNLEDLHSRVSELHQVLAGLFHAVGKVIGQRSPATPFGLQLCLPSELWDQLHVISSNPEKDFGGNYLAIYWTSKELLHLAATRFRLFMQAHHPDQLVDLRRSPPHTDEPDIDLLRAALPTRVHNGLGHQEDPIAYLLRHTQLLPRHLIEIMNSVFTETAGGSRPWSVTEEAVRLGTRRGEKIIVDGILAAHYASFPYASDALKRLANRLSICFPANDLHRVFNRSGIKKAAGVDFQEFLNMLITLGVLGIREDRTAKYNRAKFQYTFDTELNPQEDVDFLCFHPLFTRYLFENSISRLARAGELPTYPFGTDPAEGDYRVRLLGYVEGRR